jgi:hypothetical protein
MSAKQVILSLTTKYLSHMQFNTPPLVRTQYPECFRKNLPHFGRTLLRLNYIDINKNARIWSWMFTEIMAKQVLKNENKLYYYQIYMRGNGMFLC